MLIKTTRVAGAGQGSKIGFPTINVYLTPDTIALGLWALKTPYGFGMGLFSNHRGMIRGEIHILSAYQLIEVIVLPSQELEILFLQQLRGPIRITDRLLVIQQDKEMVSDFLAKNYHL